jgi:hypothetical protein
VWLCRPSAAEVDLSQFAAFVPEETMFYAGDSYKNMILTSVKLTDGVEGLSIVMDYFSINGHANSLPLSVSVTPSLAITPLGPVIAIPRCKLPY